MNHYLMERWRVVGAVDAENAFSAKIRSWWEMEILATGDDYTLGRASLSGEEVYLASDYKAQLEWAEALNRAE